MTRIRVKYPMGMILLIASFYLLISGCAGLSETHKVSEEKIIRIGQTVTFNYTCRTGNNQVIDTTIRSVADDPLIAKSRVFQEKSDYRPVSLAAGEDPYPHSVNKFKKLTPEILKRLAFALVGKTMGAKHQIDIASEVSEGLGDHPHRFEKAPLETKSPLIRTYPAGIYISKTGRAPEVGEVARFNGKPYTQVISVDDKQVKVKMIVKEDILDLRFGKAKFVNNGKEMVSTIFDAETGRLVEKYGYIGRIVEVTDKNLVVDYGHPFGGEILKCDVEILETVIKDDENKKKEINK